MVHHNTILRTRKLQAKLIFKTEEKKQQKNVERIIFFFAVTNRTIIAMLKENGACMEIDNCFVRTTNFN